MIGTSFTNSVPLVTSESQFQVLIMLPCYITVGDGANSENWQLIKFVTVCSITQVYQHWLAAQLLVMNRWKVVTLAKSSCNIAKQNHQ